MIRRRWCGALPALVLGALLAAGCSEEDKNPVGAGLLPQLSDSIREVVLAPVESESFPTASDDPSFGTLLIAAHDLPDAAGFESRALIRFALSTPDTTLGPVRVDSAQVRLFLSGLSPDSVPFTLHRLTESWQEGEVSWTNRAFDVPWTTPGGTFDATPVAQGILAGDSVSFAVPDTLVERWLTDPESNDGVALELADPDQRARITAASTTGLIEANGPALKLFVTRGDSSSVSTPIATNDAYISIYRGTVQPGLAIGNDPLFRSLLRFDLSGIPAAASINLVQLILPPRQVVAPVDSLVVELRRVVSPFLGGQTVFGSLPGDLLTSSVVRPDSSVTFSGPLLANVVRAWQASPSLNLGLGIQAQRRTANLGFAVYGDTTAPAEARPRLRIIFTPPLKSDVGPGS